MHDRVRDVGNIFRIVGDTAGAVTGGTIKAVGATVNVREERRILILHAELLLLLL